MPSVLDNLTTSSPVMTPGAAATQQVLPEWYTSFLSGLSQRGADIAGRAYTPYQGARVAGFSPLQQSAFAALPGAASAGVGTVQQAAGTVAGATNPWSSAYRDNYMSPYISGVTDEIARRGNQNFTENLMPSVNGAFTGAGQFGSTRNAEILGRTMRDVQRDITGAQTNALNAAYTGAQGQFNADQNRALSGAQILGGLGQTQQTMGLTGANAMLGAGGVQQQQQQRGLDTAYQDFQTSQNFDQNQLMNYRNLMNGLQLPAGSTSASNTATGAFGSSPLELILALLNGG